MRLLQPESITRKIRAERGTENSRPKEEIKYCVANEDSKG